MTFRLIDRNWGTELSNAALVDSSALRIICPFIKIDALKSILGRSLPRRLQVITRFDLGDFAQGVSDTSALSFVLGKKGAIRGVRHLHAKVFIFGMSRVIVTSANLTTAALNRNHEFGFVSDDPEIIKNASDYFDALWMRAGKDLLSSRIDEWDRKIEKYLAMGGLTARPTGLGDDGTDAGILAEEPELIPWTDPVRQAFVKFLGEANNRVRLDFTTIEEIERAGCHWALAYPASKRPTGVRDGALMFIARMTRDPNDIRIFGRAIGMKYVRGRDDASPKDIARHDWKSQWPRYIRVHDAEFISGTMADGISLNELMAALGPNSFAPTQRNSTRGSGNTDPRRAYNQQAAVELSPQAVAWLVPRLERAFSRHGKVPTEELDRVGWPTLPKSW